MVSHMPKSKKMKVEFAPGFKVPDDPDVKKALDAFVKAMQSMDVVDLQVAEDMGEIDLGDDIGVVTITNIGDLETEH